MSLLFSFLYLFCFSLFGEAHPHSPRVKETLSLQHPTTGISRTGDGSRMFLLYNRFDESVGPGLVEHQGNGSWKPFPDNSWNNYTTGSSASKSFVNVAAQRVGPDGQLWVLDNGLAKTGAIVGGGPKLVTVNLTSNITSRVYDMSKLVKPTSLLDDIRFNDEIAYITDAGAASIIAVDLRSGNGKRLLENCLALRQYMPTSGEGSLMRTSDGGFNFIYVDQLEVSPDGKFLYFQPTAGGMSRVATRYLDGALHSTWYNETELYSHVEPFSHTPSSGSTAIDANGNIYISDTDRQEILRIRPNGTSEIFVHDARLLWVDGMWLDGQNRLWLPAAQFNRAPQWHNGTSEIKPLKVYTIDVGLGPSIRDHH